MWLITEQRIACSDFPLIARPWHRLNSSNRLSGSQRPSLTPTAPLTGPDPTLTRSITRERTLSQEPILKNTIILRNAKILMEETRADGLMSTEVKNQGAFPLNSGVCTALCSTQSFLNCLPGGGRWCMV